MNVGWNKYQEQFPTRYTRYGEIDRIFISKIANLTPENNVILDVGGGVNGSIAIRSFAKPYDAPAPIIADILDPYISGIPQWYRNKVSYDDLGMYDLIIARGSINYLSPDEICKVISSLKRNGSFIANTFLNRPSTEWREREVINGKGEIGIEASRCDGDWVYHKLTFQSYSIEHKFHYYTIDQFREMIGPKLQVIDYTNTSSIIIYLDQSSD